MDYTIIPRKELYRDRTSIEDFDINRDGSIEKLMLERMYFEPHIINSENAEEIVLGIFNMAHYLTTMILADSQPMLHLGKYLKIASKICVAPGYEMNTYGRYFSAMAMAMVVNFLKICDDKYCNEGEIFILSLNEWHHKEFKNGLWDDDARFLFYNNVVSNDAIIKARQFMSRDDFQPIPSLKVFEQKVMESNKRENKEDLKQAIAEVEARLEAKIPRFEYDEQNQGLKIVQGTNNKAMDVVEDSDKETLKAEIKQLRDENLSLKEKLNELCEWYTDFDENYTKMNDQVKESDRERIVFFATVLSLDINKKYTILNNLAKFIAVMCNEDARIIGPMLSKMNKPESAKANAKAAAKIANLLSIILPEDCRHDPKLTINKIIDSLKLNFPDEEE